MRPLDYFPLYSSYISAHGYNIAKAEAEFMKKRKMDKIKLNYWSVSKPSQDDSKGFKNYFSKLAGLIQGHKHIEYAW